MSTFCTFHRLPTTMMKVEENDIGKLLHKMRQRQSNIRKSFDQDTSNYAHTSLSNAPSSTLSTSSSASAFETRLQRIRQIRKKFEDKYSILRNSQSSEHDAVSKVSARSQSAKSCRPCSAQTTMDAVHQTVEVPLTARDDLDIVKPQQQHSEHQENAPHSATNQTSSVIYKQCKSLPLDIESHSNNPKAADHPLSASTKKRNMSTIDDQNSNSRSQCTESSDISIAFGASSKPKLQKCARKISKHRNSSHYPSSSSSSSSSRTVHFLGDLPENIFFEIYQSLDAITLATMCRVSSSWHSTIIQSIRFMFSIPFQCYPKRLPPKTMLFTLKKLHFIDAKSCGELLFWSCARGYDAFLRHFISNIDRHRDHMHSVNTKTNTNCNTLKLPSIKRQLNAISKVDDMTSLHIAAKHNQLHILRILCAHPTVDVNRLTKSGKHVIIIAAQRSNYEVVDELLTHQHINVDQTDPEQRSLLHTLCAMGDLYAVNAVLSKGADPNVVDKENRSPLYIAAESGYIDICRCLLRKNSEMRLQWQSDKASDPHSESNQKEPEYPVDVLLTSKSGKSPLYAASENGHTEVVAFLLQNGANVRQETCRGKIPLYAAAEKQYVNIVRELLPFTMEKDLFKLTHYGTTAMFIASKQSNKTVKKMLIAFCNSQKKMKQKKINTPSPAAVGIADGGYDAVHDVDERKEESEGKEWMNTTVDHHHVHVQRPETPKFKEQFDSFQEMKQKRKRQSFTKTTAFLERMNNLIKIADAAEEEKDPSVPRVGVIGNENDKKTKPKSKPRRNEKRRRIRRPRTERQQSSESNQLMESKEEDDDDSTSAMDPETAEAVSEPVRPKKCAFDYNRLYRGKLRNETEEDPMEETADTASEPKKRWKGFSDRFMMRNLVGTKKQSQSQSDVDSDLDQMLAIDEEEESRASKERDRISKEAASRFLERQKERNAEAQRKAKERVSEYKNRDQMERKRLIKKREAARVLAMKVAAKIQEKERFDENIKAFSKDVAVTAVGGDAVTEQEDEDAVSDPCLNLFDKLRRKGISNENFRDDQRLHSHRSLGSLDGIKREKRRSLEVTGRILNVLSDRATKSSGGEMDREHGDMAMHGILDSDLENEEDGFLFLHPLSKSKRKKMRQNKLAAAYGVSMKPKRKKKAVNKTKALDCLLQINSMNPQNR